MSSGSFHMATAYIEKVCQTGETLNGFSRDIHLIVKVQIHLWTK